MRRKGEIVPSALEQMRGVVNKAPQVLQEIKEKTGRRMIGIFHAVVPEELVYAAGAYPVRLFPYFSDAITVADASLQTFICSYLRAEWDQILKGRYPYLDGVILPRSCEAVTFLYQIWKRHNPNHFIDYLNVPWVQSERAINFFARELDRVKLHLEEYTASKISMDSLRHAIRLYNKNRKLLRKVYDLRKSYSPAIYGAEIYSVIMSSFVLDKQEHNRLLEQLLAELDRQPPRSPTQVRLLVSGDCVVDEPLWGMIEAAGAVIVADDTNNGSRTFWRLVDEEEKDPLLALARSYSTVPSAFNTSIADRFSYISEMITEYKVNGVIFAINKNCEAEQFDYPELDKKVKDSFHVPTLNIETDYLVDVASQRTRVEAFIETLKV